MLVLTRCGGGSASPTGTEQPLNSGEASTSTAVTTSVTGLDKELLGAWKEISDTAGNPLETCLFDEDGSSACSAGNGQDQIGIWAQVDSGHIQFDYQGVQAVLEYHIDGKKLTMSFSNPASTQVYEKE